MKRTSVSLILRRLQITYLERLFAYILELMIEVISLKEYVFDQSYCEEVTNEAYFR